MDLSASTAAVVSIVVAVAGYLATYVNGVRLAQRNDRLMRVNRQLSDLYGPLLALSEADRITFEHFSERREHVRAQLSPAADPARDSPTDSEIQEWRLWVLKVFMPSNRRMYDLISRKADLLVEDRMPDVLLMFCAHVAGYEVTLGRWENSDYSELSSIVPFPDPGFSRYVSTSFARLKKEQLRLLGEN